MKIYHLVFITNELIKVKQTKWNAKQTTSLSQIVFTVRIQSNTVHGLIIKHCSTSQSSAGNPSGNSCLLQDTPGDSLWEQSKVRILGWGGSPVGLTNSVASCNIPGGHSADSGIAVGWSLTPFWWASHSMRRRRRKRRSPVGNKCWDPQGCRKSVTPMRSKGPEREEDIEITLGRTAGVPHGGHPTKARPRAHQEHLWVVFLI